MFTFQDTSLTGLGKYIRVQHFTDFSLRVFMISRQISFSKLKLISNTLKISQVRASVILSIENVVSFD